MTRLEWHTSEPRGPGRRSKYDWTAIAADLRKHPGDWAIVDRNAGLGVAWAINRPNGIVALRETDEWRYEARRENIDRFARRCTLSVRAIRKQESDT